MLSLGTPRNTRRKTLSVQIQNTPQTANKMRTRRSVFFEAPEQNEATTLTPLKLSKLPESTKTPQSLQNNFQITKTPVSKALDPVMEKIHRDLNSPSATARIRANKALKSPNFRKKNYEVFDIPHEEQDIITEEERLPYKPKTVREIFNKCRIFVEVRTGDDNRSAGIKSKLISDGIRVNDKLLKDTTHVIFKDGLVSTYKQAKKLGIPVTTILWIDTCKAQKRLVDPNNFQISNLERYENSELFPRIRRQKSFQPQISKMVVHNPLKNNLQVNDEKENHIDLKNDSYKMSEPDKNETVKNCIGMELTLNIESEESNTSSSTSSMNIATQLSVLKSVENPNSNARRITTFTPRPMEQTACAIAPAWKSIERRKTIYTSQLEQENSYSTPNNNTFCANLESKIIFNSANRICSASRRSVLDISMNIFELNCKAIRESNKKNDECIETSMSQSDNVLGTQIVSVPVVRKRKLFSAESPDASLEYKENIESTQKQVEKKTKHDDSIKGKFNKSIKDHKSRKLSTLAPVDKRKTISYFKTSKPIGSNCKKVITTPLKPSIKYIVCTNIPSSTDKQLAQAGILKLKGVYESIVTDKTTHVVTTNVERTMNLLRGIIRACYIVRLDWIKDSIKAGKFLDTTLYQHSICNTQKIYERSVLGKNFKNLSFKHHGPFYINKETIDNEKKYEYLCEIIKRCNGNLIDERSEAKIIVSDHPLKSDVSAKKPIIVISTYIFDSAMQGKMIHTAKYVPKTNKN